MAAFPALAQEQTAPPAAPPQSAPQTQKAATQIEVTASSAASVAGSSVTFTTVVTGTGGTPTGTVTFKDGESVLDSASLSEGRARLTTSALPAGPRAITAAYSGDATFEGSVSPVLPHSVAKAATTIALTVSGTASEVGQAVTFTAIVSGKGGVPTGTVTFKGGKSVLHSAELSEGRAQWTSSDLAAGQHIITAAYGGDAAFGESASEPKPHLVQQKGWAALVLLAAIILAALLVLLRRLLFRLLVRPAARMLRALFRHLRRLLRLGGRASARQRPGKSAFSLGMGALAEGFTETEDAIAADGFEPSSVRIERNSRFVCSWMRPQPEKHRHDPEEDFAKAKHLFDSKVPLGSNPLNLYDDIHNASIVGLFSRSDKPCFHILSEFKKTISANVIALTVTYTLIVSAVLVVNLTVSTSLDLYQSLDLGERWGLPSELIVPYLGFKISIAAELDRLVFALMSCLVAFLLMSGFNNLFYEQSQRFNGTMMDRFLVDYLSNIKNEFETIQREASQAVIRERGIEAVTRETLILMTDLSWMAIRIQFIKQFLRNILFQIHRNRAFAVFFVPLGFGSVLLIAFWLLARSEVFVVGSNAHNYWFYILFLWLLYEYGRYLARALAPITESISPQASMTESIKEEEEEGKSEENQYDRYHLEFVDAMAGIMRSYAAQLDQLRTRFRPGEGPGSQ